MRNAFPALAAAAFVLCAALAARPAHAQEAPPAEASDPVAELPWEIGPTTGRMAERAAIDLPEGFVFLGPEGARGFNELMENPPSGVDEFVVAPDDLRWTAYFWFDPVGYVEDDEALDPDAILQSIREGTQAGNEERTARGWETMTILGWSFEPQYDKQLNSLEWAVLAQMDQSGEQLVNYNTRLLGRRGVMHVILVADPATLAASIAEFKGLMPGYAFAAGERYAEFQPGDHVAEYGLAALITGGAAAVAAKKGWLAAIGVFLLKMWKLLLAALVGGGLFLRKLFGKRAADAAGGSDGQS